MAGNLRDFDKDSLGGFPLVVPGDLWGISAVYGFLVIKVLWTYGTFIRFQIAPKYSGIKKNRPLVLPREVREDRAHGIILKLSIPKNIGKTEFLLKTIIKIFKLNNLSYLAKIVMDNPGVQ